MTIGGGFPLRGVSDSSVHPLRNQTNHSESGFAVLTQETSDLKVFAALVRNKQRATQLRVRCSCCFLKWLKLPDMTFVSKTFKRSTSQNIFPSMASMGTCSLQSKLNAKQRQFPPGTRKNSLGCESLKKSGSSVSI